jgi:hypothetical protein
MLGEIEIAPRRCVPGPWQAREVRERIERQVHFRRRSAESIVMDVLDELVRQLARLDETKKRQSRVDARGDDAGVDLVAVCQHDAVRLVAAHEDTLDLDLRSDLDSGGPCRARDRV